MITRIMVGVLLSVLVLLSYGIWLVTSEEPVRHHRPVPCQAGACWERSHK